MKSIDKIEEFILNASRAIGVKNITIIKCEKVYE